MCVYEYTIYNCAFSIITLRVCKYKLLCYAFALLSFSILFLFFLFFYSLMIMYDKTVYLERLISLVTIVQWTLKPLTIIIIRISKSMTFSIAEYMWKELITLLFCNAINSLRIGVNFPSSMQLALSRGRNCTYLY